MDGISHLESHSCLLDFQNIFSTADFASGFRKAAESVMLF